MLRGLQVLILSLLLSSCAVTDVSGGWRRAVDIETTTITVKTYPDPGPSAVCRALIGHGNWQACAQWTRTHCTVHIHESLPEYILGHEVKHCLGFVHD